MRWITVMALLALWPGNGLAAQQAGVGSKVRWQETGGWVEGRLEEAIVRGGPLLVRSEGGRGLMGDQRARRGTVERVGLDAERLEWQRRPGRRNQGALIGASVAAALGVAIGLVTGRRRRGAAGPGGRAGGCALRAGRAVGAGGGGRCHAYVTVSRQRRGGSAGRVLRRSEQRTANGER